MNWYKVCLKLKAWTASEWQSDIIFGHLCWGMLYLYGEEKLAEFLRYYLEGEPPLLVSNGFPADLLPLPLTSPSVINTGVPLQKQREQYAEFKRQRSIKYITLKEFNGILAGQVPQQLIGSEAKIVKRIGLKNQLDRYSGTTTPGGQLFNFEEYYLPEITIYSRLDAEFQPVAEKLFSYLADTGFGKRKSVGYGSIESMSLEQFSGFNIPQKANGFVTLSNFVPAAGDPVRGNWATVTKYGRMGEAYAQEEHAFKKPLLMFAAGSTFYADKPRQYCGQMVSGLNPHYAQAVHYAYALPVPMVIS